MIKPTVEQLQEYADYLRYREFDPQAFLDHYEANGWMVGRNHMKDWKASVRTWRHMGRKHKWDRPQVRMPWQKRQDKINELNRRKQQLVREGAPYWKIHEINMQLQKL
jgi:hypothetical protein